LRDASGNVLKVQRDVEFRDLPAGDYSVVKRSVNDPACASSATSITLEGSETVPVVGTLDVLQPSCNVAGSIEVTGGSTGAYEYVLINTETGEELKQSSGLFEEVAPGRYVVKLRGTADAGCISEASIAVTIGDSIETPSPVSLLGANPTTCGGYGSITVSDPQSGAYEYVLRDASGNVLKVQRDVEFRDLPAGDYSVVKRSVNDPACASSATSITLEGSETVPVVGTLDVLQPSCNVAGSIEVTGGSTGAYEYVLINTETGEELKQSSGLFEEVAPGRYVVKLRGTADAGCISEASIAVTIGDSIETPSPVSLLGANPTTCGGYGSITVSDPQSGAYEYVLRDASGNVLKVQRDVEFRDLPAGDYSVVKRSVNDPACASSATSITLEGSETVPVVGTLDVLQPSCNVAGSIEVTGGSTGAYEYVLINTETGEELKQSSGLFEEVAPGRYVVKLRGTADAGCISEASIAVTIGDSIETPSPVSLLGANPTTCGGYGSITVSDPQSGAYEYVLRDASGNVLKVQRDVEFRDLPAGDYSVVKRSVNDPACASSATSITLEGSETVPVVGTLDVLQPSCNVAGSIEVTGGSTGAYEYVLINTETGEELKQSSGLFEEVAPGRYVVKLRGTADAGCISEASIAVTIGDSIETPSPVSLLGANPTTCGGYGSITVSDPQSGSYEYVLRDASGNVLKVQRDVEFRDLPAGDYSVVKRSVNDPACASSATSITLEGSETVPVVGTLDVLQPSCNVAGSIEVTGGSTGAYEYVLINTETGE